MTVICIIICILLCFRYNRTLNYLKATYAIQPDTSFSRSGLFFWFLFEFLLCLVHSFPGLPFEVLNYPTTIQFKDSFGRVVNRTESVEYTLDTILGFVCFAKVYLVLRLFIHFLSFLNSPDIAMVAQKMDYRLSFWFSF